MALYKDGPWEEDPNLLGSAIDKVADDRLVEIYFSIPPVHRNPGRYMRVQVTEELYRRVFALARPWGANL